MYVNVIVTYSLKNSLRPTFTISSLYQRSVLATAQVLSCLFKALWLSNLLRCPVSCLAFTTAGGWLPRLSTIP